MIQEDAQRPARSIAATRLAIGVLQGAAIYFLYRAAEDHFWPATNGFAYAPLLLIAVLIPICASLGLGSIRTRTLALSTAIAALLLPGLALHDIDRGDVLGFFSTTPPGAARIAPSWIVWLAAMAVFFVGQSLIQAADGERRILAGYASYFDAAWKNGVQLALSAGFVRLFWGLLWLGAELFKLIEIDFIDRLIRHLWFSVPATTLSAACAIHVTDIRVGLVRGVRTLALTLLSWLLPLLTLIVAGFVVALPFTGLEPLWKTRHATAVLLVAANALLVLLNAAYQDGDSARKPPAVLRHTGSLAAVLLVPLAVIAGYGLALRIGQHGLTPSRIFAGAVIAVTSCHALLYGLAAALPGRWLALLERANVATAIFALAVLLALSTPLADPWRLSVADQLQRLRSGAIRPEAFDFKFLRFDSGRYGLTALERLSAQREGANAPLIARMASEALALPDRYSLSLATPERRAANITVHPSGKALPEAFLQQNWTADRWRSPACLTELATCDAFFADLDGDGVSEILILAPKGQRSAAFVLGGDGRWAYLGAIEGAGCPGVLDAFRAGDFSLARPQLNEIDARGTRLRIASRSVVCR